MVHKVIFSISCTLLFVIMCGCNSQELTRGKAKKILKAGWFTAQTSVIHPTKAETDALVAKHLVAIDKRVFLAGTMVLLPDGQHFFISTDTGWGGNFSLVAPVKVRIIEVTGISDAPGDASGKRKIVDCEWNWNFDDAPPDIKSILADQPTQTANVELRLYDDGWRVVEGK